MKSIKKKLESRLDTDVKSVSSISECKQEDYQIDDKTGQHPSAEDEILCWIKTAQSKLGLVFKQENYVCHLDQSTGNSTRESVVAVGGPVAGVKDLKLLLQQRSLQKMNTLNAFLEADFAYAVRVDQDVPNNKCNPYNLRLVSSDIALAFDVHYTVSAYYVTEVSRKIIVSCVVLIICSFDIDV